METLSDVRGGLAGGLRVLHVCDALLHPTETFVQQRLRGLRFAPQALAWQRVADGLDIPCPHSFLPVRIADPTHSWLRRRAGGAVRAIQRRFDRFEAIRRAAPHVVHAHFGTVGARIVADCRRLRVPLVVSFYGWDATWAPTFPSLRRPYRRLFRSDVTFTAEGPALAKRLIRLGASASRVNLLPLALPPWATAEPRRRPDLHDPTLRLLQVARLVEKKGVDTTLRALGLARSRGARTELVVGGDGPLRESLRGLCRSLGLEGAVTWTGFVPHERLREFFSAAHALVQPSRTASSGDTEGGTPTIVIEAQAQGLPLLGTRHADIPWVVRDGVSALLVAESDHVSLAERLLALCTDRRLLDRLSRAARPWIMRRHDPSRLLVRQERIYLRAIARSRAPSSLATPFASGPGQRH